MFESSSEKIYAKVILKRSTKSEPFFHL